MSHPLDRPIWTALHTRQAHLSVDGGSAVRFPADIGPFVAGSDASPQAIAAIIGLVPVGDEISLMEVAPPEAPPGINADRVSVVQMEARAITAGAGRADIAPLTDHDAPEMLELALLTRPGPFRARTHTLGRFLGVRDKGRLVAMAGERMQADGCTEISAVCTLPDYRGRGLGAALMRAVGDRLLSEGITPFLHSYAANTTAIELYRKLGFTVRREMVRALWKRA